MACNVIGERSSDESKWRANHGFTRFIRVMQSIEQGRPGFASFSGFPITERYEFTQA